MALAVILPGTARPAQAADDVHRVPAVENLVNVVFVGLDMFVNRDASPSRFLEMARQLSGAVGQAVPTTAEEVRKHTDSVVVADVNGYLNHIRVEMVDFTVWADNEIAASDNARDFARYAGAAKAQLERPGIDQTSANAIGFAINVLYANAVVVRDLEILGYPGGGTQLLVDQIAANRHMSQRLAPECRYVALPAPEGSIHQVYRCRGADGTVKEGPLEVFMVGVGWLEPQLTDAQRKALAEAAGAKTSWAVAVSILPELERALAQRTP
ncbi:hypothetical protein ACTMTJ_37120 [Phytohabitans sp. LJ34]|uniref:hypothetical protein n=1 Tax=Phytohabitans sp. LJ34 TaxID=3452217 RepID=UPI003F89ABF5